MSTSRHPLTIYNIVGRCQQASQLPPSTLSRDRRRHLFRSSVSPDAVLDVAEREPARSFDAPGAAYTHRDGKCSVEALIDDSDLGGDLALLRLARIVHAADVAEDRDSDPLGAGLEAIGSGGLDVETDDHRLLERGSFVTTRCTHGADAKRRSQAELGMS